MLPGRDIRIGNPEFVAEAAAGDKVDGHIIQTIAVEAHAEVVDQRGSKDAHVAGGNMLGRLVGYTGKRGLVAQTYGS